MTPDLRKVRGYARFNANNGGLSQLQHDNRVPTCTFLHCYNPDHTHCSRL